jgi:DNA (cytosine-5)-methyltransferase 1
MAQKSPKGQKRKATPRKEAREETAKVVLVGTYKGDQLTRWRSWYNYPILDGDKITEADAAKITELWLFKGTKDERHYKAEFVGIKTRQELIDGYGYPARGKAHGNRYLLFKTEYKYQHKLTLPEDAERVIVRTADFARSPKVRSQLKAYLESPDRNDPGLAKRLPEIITKLRPAQLRVCEAAVQLDFLAQMMVPCRENNTPLIFAPEKKGLRAALTDDLPKVDRPFTHVDCFSGVGGFCTGLYAAGFTTLVAIEKVKSCVETYVANHPDVHVINNDIRNVAAKEILPFCPSDGVDLVTSGMPCETFSTAGNTSRSFYDDRQFLFREGIRVANIVKAKFLLFENVPGITSKTVSKGGSTLIVDVLKEEMTKAGYGNFIEVILDATRFGVPQRRKRFFILGTRMGTVRLRRPISRVARMFSVGDALEGLPPVVPNSWQDGKSYTPLHGEYAALMRDDVFWRRGDCRTNSISYHMPMKHRPATLERFARLEQGESLRDLFVKYKGEELKALQLRHVVPKKIFIKRNYRLPVNEPSPTVTSHCLDEFVHPSENRALTVRECARLQSFPDSYDFAGGPYIVPHINRDVQDKYEQIGDAVPPLLAFAWGKTILEMLTEDKP